MKRDSAYVMTRASFGTGQHYTARTAVQPEHRHCVVVALILASVGVLVVKVDVFVQVCVVHHHLQQRAITSTSTSSQWLAIRGSAAVGETHVVFPELLRLVALVRLEPAADTDTSKQASKCTLYKISVYRSNIYSTCSCTAYVLPLRTGLSTVNDL